jgi:D-serine deaminase-like pyridoxal phosphate-dependent protein
MSTLRKQPINMNELETPCLVLDARRMDHNIERLRARLGLMGARLRVHLKTAKSVEVAQRIMSDPRDPITVSTLREAEVFADAGITDILYAVGIAPHRLDRVVALRMKGVNVSIILDSLEQASSVVATVRETGDAIPVAIEIDCDGHRGGLRHGDPALIATGRILHEGGAILRGVMTHAGGSYGCVGADELEAAAETERSAAVACAEALRGAGLPCPVISVGSTPTAHFARDLTGVTEVRAGVFMFFDLVMAGIGVCALDDIALSVLCTVVGHQRDRGWILVDAGWMALSRDRGTARQVIDQGYGVVCDIQGRPFPDLIVAQANQEHGIVTLRDGSCASLPDLPIGTRLRILPNHACATGAQHERYHVVEDDSLTVRDVWNRFSGW